MHRSPRKRFGQNFLVDRDVVDRIVSAIAPRAGEPIIEIGPGRGALTRPLLEAGANLHVIEIDRDLAADLPHRITGLTSDRVHVGDALEADLAALVPTSPGETVRVVGNLPYNVSTPLLVRLMKSAGAFRDMHFMLQKEVVERMAAAAGGREYGRLSLMCQYHCSVSALFTVPAEAFQPPPKVESGFVRLVPHAGPPVEVPDYAAFERLVAQAFSQRRKTLRNSLRPLLAVEAIRAAGVDPALRAEALSLEDYAALTRVMAHYERTTR